MSKSSRDLSKGIAVKSNGFKYGGGKDEGWGTGQAKGRRLGKGQGERDVAARARLKARLLARTEARAEGEARGGGHIPVNRLFRTSLITTTKS